MVFKNGKPFFAVDLEGTTGIYADNSNHKNDTIRLRPGFREFIESYNEGEFNMAITTRAPKHFADEIWRNLGNRGLPLLCDFYTKSDVEIPDFVPYKDYRKAFSKNGVSHPPSQSVIFGDFLRFSSDRRGFTRKGYMNFDFETRKEVLSENYSLNDHPFPRNGETPLYVVFPQPWTTDTTLSFDFAKNLLLMLYELGENNFKEGIKRIGNSKTFQHINSDLLARAKLGVGFYQDYLILKGEDKDWRTLDILM